MDKALTRRNFIRTAAGASAALAARPAVTAENRRRSIGANDRIRIGQIGCGDRGINVHMKSVQKHGDAMNVEFVAICDPWRLAREKASAQVKEWYGHDPQAFVSYRDLLAKADVDAVMIATPDHQHTTLLEAAARAGKHVYVEKPIATDFDRMVKAVDAVREAGVVCQVGTQLRSLPTMVGCRDLVKTGIFGKITRVEECRNSDQPYWYRYLKDVREEDVDWKEFLMDRPMRPFRSDLYSGWYGYYEFSQGPETNLAVHFIDLVHFITGVKFPETCVCLGGTYYWKDEHGFTAPDQTQVLWSYPPSSETGAEGLFVSCTTNTASSAGSLKRLYGDKGMLKFDNWNAPTYSPEGGKKRDGSIRGENPVPPVERPDHFLDWLQCMREGRTPHASIEAGYQHAVAVLMASKSYETGRKIVYDHAKREIRSA
ncbi:MAG TPA: Gfo/Idh/MocA family oxidoreductase [Verrucomicrobiae bacterium]|nr:Gfo/Idh/MocA family oxidoreductase [Verrucomicrobiae bacterium]